MPYSRSRVFIAGVLCCVAVAIVGALTLVAVEPPDPASDRPIRAVPSAAPSSVEIPRAARHHGVSWVAGEEIGRKDLEPLVHHNVEWIAQTPFGWQKGVDGNEVRLVTDGRVYWGERDVGLRTTTRLARELGIKTLLKPHIWVEDADGKWRSDIAMADEESWQAWFASYRTFMLHYAHLAEEERIEALAVGTELHRTAVEREDDWRRLIAEVREVYSGEITYAANWWKEFEEIRFWDVLDWIGVQAYFPLSESAHPTVEEMVEGWRPHLEILAATSRRWGKKVVFTEVGYKSMAGAAAKPWEWEPRSPLAHPKPDFATQTNAYEAFFQAAWQQPWCGGAYWWKWFPKKGDRRGIGFSPQGKPAARVLARWYGEGRETPPESTPE